MPGRSPARPRSAARSTAVTVAALILAEVLAGACSPVGGPPASALLRETWNSYRHDFITGDGQVRDFLQRGPFFSEHVPQVQTTSEGQSYAMLRSVWMDDRAEFDLVWRWTQTHLQVRHDALFAWLWQLDGAETGRVRSWSSAADADEDIALALIFAGHRWRDPAYLSSARRILDDIWRAEVVSLGATYYLTAGDWASDYPAGPVLNPSYFAPYAYRIFAREDPAHPWEALVAGSYRALRDCSWSPLDKRRSAGLPPNWCVLGRRSGRAEPFPVSHGTDYGYDAFRVMWRIAIDESWYRSRDARRYLQESSYLRHEWSRHGRIAAQYPHDGGSAAGSWEDPTIYGGDVGNFLVTDPPAASSLLQDKLLASFRAGGGAAYWGERWSYYRQNWVWFGVALASGELPNLAAR